MTRTLRDELVKKGLAATPQEKSSQKRPEQKKGAGFYSQKAIDKERLTRDIEELMGVRRPKYHRVKGSYRSR